MFASYSDYLKAAHSALEGKPNGTGYLNSYGTMLMLNGELCYVEKGDQLHESSALTEPFWDDAINEEEFKSLQSPVFEATFSPADVELYLSRKTDRKRLFRNIEY